MGSGNAVIRRAPISCPARLPGDWFSGPWRFSPSASLVYFSETQQSYLDSLSIAIPEQTLTLGSLSFGPEIGYQLHLDGGIVEPFIGLKGVWDFEQDDTATIGGLGVGSDDWHGRIEAGATIRTPWGLSVRATGVYDGVGDEDLQLFQGQLTVSVPLN